MKNSADFEVKYDVLFEERVTELMGQFTSEQFEKIGRAVARTLLTTDFPIATVFFSDHGRNISVRDAFSELIGSVRIGNDTSLKTIHHPRKKAA